VAQILSQQPAWLTNTIIPKYTSRQASAFHMYGSGIFDFGAPGIQFNDYLSITFGGKFPLQVFFEPATGFTYPLLDDPDSEDDSKKSFERWFNETTKQDPAVLYKATAENALAILIKWLGSVEMDSSGNPTGQRRMAIVNRMDLCYSSKHGREPSPSTINLMHDHCGRSKAIVASGNMLLMLSESLPSVHESLRDASNGIVHIEVGLPDEEERYSYIHDRIRRIKNGQVTDTVHVKLEMSERQFAGATSGLARMDIEDIILESQITGFVGWDMVKHMSAEAIKTEAAGLLTVFNPKYGRSALGGMEVFKKYSDERIIGPANSDDPEMKSVMPYVVVLVGPPGTAKSETAAALGKDLNWNVLAWAQLKDSLLGATENNNAKANTIIKSKYPEVLIWDEADQDGGNRGDGPNTHSVDQAMFRSRLLLLNDTSLRGKLLIVVIANWGDRLDPAILDRADEVIPFLPAESTEARAEILAKLFEKEAGVVTTADAMVPAAALLDDRWSGRDMKGLVVKASSLMKIHKLSVIDAITRAAKTRRPSQGAEVQAMIDSALLLTKDEELIPEHYRERAAMLRGGGTEKPKQKAEDRSFSEGPRDF
jgi:hypothetical protein